MKVESHNGRDSFVIHLERLVSAILDLLPGARGKGGGDWGSRFAHWISLQIHAGRCIESIHKIDESFLAETDVHSIALSLRFTSP